MAVNLWQVQNFYNVAATRHRDLLAESPAATEAEDRAALAAEFRRLGSRLNFNLHAVLASAQTPP